MRGGEKGARAPYHGEFWRCTLIEVDTRLRVGRGIGVKPPVVFGSPEQVCAALHTHTAYVERTNLTSRLMNGRLVGKTLGFSRRVLVG